MKFLFALLAVMLLASVIVQARSSVDEYEQSHDGEDMDLNMDTDADADADADDQETTQGDSAIQDDTTAQNFDCIKAGGVFVRLQDGQNWSSVPGTLSFQARTPNNDLTKAQFAEAKKWYLEMRSYLMKGLFPFKTTISPKNPNRCIRKEIFAETKRVFFSVDPFAKNDFDQSKWNTVTRAFVKMFDLKTWN